MSFAGALKKFFFYFTFSPKKDSVANTDENNISARFNVYVDCEEKKERGSTTHTTMANLRNYTKEA